MENRREGIIKGDRDWLRGTLKGEGYKNNLAAQVDSYFFKERPRHTTHNVLKSRSRTG